MLNIKLNKTLKDIQWSFISLITASFVQLLLRIMLSKDLGPTGLGIYTLVFTVYMFGMQFSAFGIEAALIKFIAQNKGNQRQINQYISSGIMISIISGSIIGLILYSFSRTIAIGLFDNIQMVDLLKTTALCFPFISIQKSVLGTLNGFRDMKSYAFINILLNISTLFLSLFLVSLNMGIMGAVIGFVLPTILVGALSLLYVKSNVAFPLNIWSTANKELVTFGFYVVLASSVGIVNMQIDSVCIGYFMEETYVGYYSVAIIFAQGIILFPQALQKVTTPTIATLYSKNNFVEIKELIRDVSCKTFALALFISILIIYFGKVLITILFTEEFLPAYIPLTILLIGYVVFSMFASIGGTLSSIGKVKMIFKISAFSAFLNTLLNVALIPKFGLIGAASATSLSLITTVIINYYFIHKFTSSI